MREWEGKIEGDGGGATRTRSSSKGSEPFIRKIKRPALACYSRNANIPVVRFP